MIAAIVLAAGASTRLGQPKQLLMRRGKSFLRHAVESAIGGGCRPVLVVLGAQAETLGREIADLPVEIVLHAGWSEGMASSIRAGVEAVRQHHGEARAVLILTTDQPHIGPELIAELCGSFDGGVVACEYAGTLGVPALFGRVYFDELLALRGDRGAKRVLERHRERLVRRPWPEGALDVDRPEDRDDDS